MVVLRKLHNRIVVGFCKDLVYLMAQGSYLQLRLLLAGKAVISTKVIYLQLTLKFFFRLSSVFAIRRLRGSVLAETHVAVDELLLISVRKLRDF